MQREPVMSSALRGGIRTAIITIRAVITIRIGIIGTAAITGTVIGIGATATAGTCGAMVTGFASAADRMLLLQYGGPGFGRGFSIFAL